jgi:hypothetical protein
MGLDISAYNNIKFVSELPYIPDSEDEIDWDSVDDDLIVLHQNESFPTHCSDLKDGVYGGNEVHSFRAGSYSGYSLFRDFLSCTFLGIPSMEQYFHPTEIKNKPFYELVDFTDCDGVIGTELSAKLYKDFVDNEAEFLVKLSDNFRKTDWEFKGFKRVYLDFKQAFELASNNGFVKFH